MLFSYYTVGEIRNIAFHYKTIKRRMKRKIFQIDNKCHICYVFLGIIHYYI
ncbi:hypothetical protein COJ52_31240, partial [Bacillus cereus]